MHSSDEALARALQAQYEADERRRSSRRVNRSSSSSSNPNNNRTTRSAPRNSRSASSSSNPPPTVPRESSTLSTAAIEVSDAEYARQLAAEERSRNRRYRQSLPREQQVVEARRQRSFLEGSMTDEEYARSLAEGASPSRHSQRRSQRTSARTMPPPIPNAPSSRSSFDPFDSFEGEVIDVQDLDDEAFARAIAERESKRAHAHAFHNTPKTSRSSSEEDMMMTVEPTMTTDDEEMARRVEQELRDEEVARRYQRREELRRSEGVARNMSTITERKPCTCRRVLKWTIPMIIIASIAAGLIVYFDIDRDDFRGIFPGEQDFLNEDPFESIPPEEANRWRTRGNGLTLEILNALDDRWYSFFDRSIAEWDQGSPDALTLFTSIRSPEPVCEAVQGKLKICNGNYGDNRWRGINQILLTNGFIVASSARLNEFYLSGAGADQAAYTTCHEIGHGFGLPHSDENFLNRDLGNCMDYTNNPSVNKQPDDTNYAFLAQLYGIVPGNGGSTVSQEESVPGNRVLTEAESPDEPFPEWLQFAYKEALAEVEHDDTIPTKQGWRLLHESEHGRAHEVDLGQGYTLQVHKLLVPPDE